uniref:hypothetical protein n=1 Tax=Salmonella sp. s51228 TaxID=3159652 RepID=UPI00397EEE6F
GTWKNLSSRFAPEVCKFKGAPLNPQPYSPCSTLVNLFSKIKYFIKILSIVIFVYGIFEGHHHQVVIICFFKCNFI